MRRRLGDLLRRLAVLVDPDSDLRLSGLSFTFEPGRGYVLHGEPGTFSALHQQPGCPLLYDPKMYDRAHDEAQKT